MPERVATHQMLKGARIRVEMKTRPHMYVWATVMSDVTDIALVPKDLATDKCRGMSLFFAMTAFTVMLPQHENKQVTYEADWKLFAFPNPEDRLVRRIPKEYKQESML